MWSLVIHLVVQEYARCEVKWDISKRTYEVVARFYINALAIDKNTEVDDCPRYKGSGQEQ